MTDIKDFTRKRDRVLFRIDDDVFEAAPALPAETLSEFAAQFGTVGESESAHERFQVMTSALELVLLPDSYTRFRERLRDRAQPIEIDQLSDCLVWLLEQYGLRPTQPSYSLSDGLPDPASGTSSMDAAQPTVSTLLPSQPIAS